MKIFCGATSPIVYDTVDTQTVFNGVCACTESWCVHIVDRLLCIVQVNCFTLLLLTTLSVCNLLDEQAHARKKKNFENSDTWCYVATVCLTSLHIIRSARPPPSAVVYWSIGGSEDLEARLDKSIITLPPSQL